MELILLAGNSKLNKEWIEKMGDDLRDLFSSTKIQYYDHWNTEKSLIDFDLEIKKLSTTLQNVKEYCIFAKSAGILLALKYIKSSLIKPKNCIFVGMPINWSRANNFDIDSFIENHSIPTLFIQKKKDTAFSSEELKEFLKQKNVKNHQFVEVEGEDHDYGDVDIKKIITERITFI